MPEELTKVDRPPVWIQAFSDEIDRLEFGPGFERISAHTTWSFGTHTGIGRDALQTFFHKIDDPLISAHRLIECWSGERTHIVRGSARVEPKDGHAQATDVPFVWIFTMGQGDAGQVDDIYIVNGPLKTDAVL